MESKKKRCIFHIPMKIDPNAKSGSNIRPIKMIQAFEKNGYLVDCIWGYGKQRKELISKIKQNIEDGIKYDFLYAENSTTPTLLTEKNHFPRYFGLDFGFMKFCKKNDIQIGLFYRDVYWKFETYKKLVPFYQRIITIPFYYYDLFKYNQLVDILYLPSRKMRPYVNVVKRFSELPPGCEYIKREKVTKEQNEKKISLFYVGGIGEIYDLTKLFQAVTSLDFVNLIVCCREEEWNKEKEKYECYLNKNISIIHKSGKDLEVYYEKADICMLFFESRGYRSFAMPIKLFEYLGHEVPVIATKDSAAGEFVENMGIGWSIEHDVLKLQMLLKELCNNKKILEIKKDSLKETIVKNTWKARAEQVIQDLTKGEEK